MSEPTCHGSRPDGADCAEPARYCAAHAPDAEDNRQRLRTLNQYAGRIEGRRDTWFWTATVSLVISTLLVATVVVMWVSWPDPVPAWKRVPTIAQVTALHERVHPDCVAEVEDDLDLLEQICAPLEMMRCDPVPTLEEMCPMCPQHPTPTDVRWTQMKRDLWDCRADIVRQRKGWNGCIKQWDRVCDQCWVWGKGDQSEEQLLCKGCG